MGGVVEPARLVVLVLRWLDTLPGVTPCLPVTRAHEAIGAAAELLRVLDVEPRAGRTARKPQR